MKALITGQVGNRHISLTAKGDGHRVTIKGNDIDLNVTQQADGHREIYGSVRSPGSGVWKKMQLLETQAGVGGNYAGNQVAVVGGEGTYHGSLAADKPHQDDVQLVVPSSDSHAAMGLLQDEPFNLHQAGDIPGLQPLDYIIALAPNVRLPDGVL